MRNISVQQSSIDPAEAARRRQLAIIASRIRVSPSVAALVAAHAFGAGTSWPASIGSAANG